MRSPQDLPRRPRSTVRRGRFWLIIAVIVIVVLIASLRSLATFYTDYLWFGSVHLSGVWRKLFAVKAELFFGFAAIFFVLMFVTLTVVARLAPSELALGPEDELVRRYQQRAWRRVRRTCAHPRLGGRRPAGRSLGAIGQWRNFLLGSPTAGRSLLAIPSSTRTWVSSSSSSRSSRSW